MSKPFDSYWAYISELASQSLLLHTDSLTAATTKSVMAYSRQYSSSEIERLYKFSEATEGWLQRQLLECIASEDSLKVLFDTARHGHFLRVGCEKIESFSAVLFRLKVFQNCLPRQFQRTLYCMIFVMLESVLDSREEESFVELFICAATHDLGLLDVSRPAIESKWEHVPLFNSESEYGGHVEKSVAFIMRQGAFSDAVIRGVKEHHERMDGTGYPFGRRGIQLSEYGQHIHLYDTVFSIYEEKFRPLGKSLGDLVPIIEINSVTHFGKIASRLVEILRDCPRTDSFIDSDEKYQSYYDKAVVTAAYIESSIEIIQSFTNTVGFRHEDKQLLALQNAFLHIVLAIHKSKSNSDSVMHFITEKTIEGNELYRAKVLEEIYFIMREVNFHIEIFVRQLKSYIKFCKDPFVLDKSQLTLEAFSSVRALT